MRRMTKAQRKWKDRIEAWLKGEPFRENARAKPTVPELSLLDVLENYYPPDPTGSAQFFTPVEMAQAAYDYGSVYVREGYRVLDPCAGIGHLFYPWRHHSEAITVDAYEIEEECVELGQALFPWVHWHHRIPFDCLEDIEGQYDLVVCNPPFNIRRGMYPGEQMSDGRASKSEHFFVELCVRALQPEGLAVILGTWNLIDGMPKKMRVWFDQYAILEYKWGPLPGKFALTSVELHAYYIRRRWRDPNKENVQ